MVTMHSLARYNDLATKISPLAKIISWEVPSGVLTTRADMEQHLVQARIPITVLGKPLRERSKIERSLNVIEVELRKLNQEGVFQVEREDREATVWNWMTHVIQNVLTDNGDYRQVTTEIPRQFVYNKETKKVTATSDRLTKLEVQVRQFQQTGLVKDQYGNRIPFSLFEAAREIGELRMQVSETQQMLDDLIAKFGSVMLPKDIRAFMTRCVERANGIAFRSRGGAYIIPRPSFDWVDKLQDFVGLLGQGCVLKIVNLFDVEGLVNGLEEMAQLLGGGSIPSDLAAVIGMAKQELSSKDDVNAVFSAFEADFIQAIKTKRDALDKARAEGRATRENTLTDTLAELNDLTTKVEIFAKLLQFNAKDYLKEVSETEKAIQDYATEVARRKSEGNSGR